MKKLLFFSALGAFALSATGIDAATVSAAGTLTGLTPPGWGTGNDNADLDAAGAGADGFVLFNSIPEGGNQANTPWNQNIVDNTPAYISALDGSASTGTGGWANYDNVTLGGTTYNTGGIQRPTIGQGVEADMFTFQLAGSVPSQVILGFIVDNSDNAIWGSSNVRIEGPGAITADQNVFIDGATDLVQFNISGGLAGETYTVYATQPPGNGGALIGGVTFDSIPEPGSALLLAAAGLLAATRRRRN